ncbi:hypothetical protein [Clostridium sp.]|uniref:hypothetical protein n=1 Tax=Clostridium sp. TaxID=1506 RepID=UPI001A53A3F6|nr:hypothetical protein [Clostridium sp.]MBK5243092.1 hypothetical protein [Clostridium sp.]
MLNNFNYLVNSINSKKRKKNITVCVDEETVEKLEEIELDIGISKNQILSDNLYDLVKTYDRLKNPNYYIINSNNKNMPRGHILMMANDKVSTWGNEKESLCDIEPGDYIFLNLDTFGIVGAGRATTKFISSPFSHYECYADKEKTEVNDMVFEEEYFVMVDYDKKSFGDYDEKEFAGLAVYLDIDSIVTEEKIYDIVNSKEDPMKKFDLDQVKIKLSKEDGERLKELYLELSGGQLSLNCLNDKTQSIVDIEEDIEDIETNETNLDVTGENNFNVKPGEYVKSHMLKLFRDRAYAEELIQSFLEKNYSKDMINVNYPLLKKIDMKSSISEQARIDGMPRYWVKPIIDIKGEKYLICSQWYQWNIRDFEQWYEKVSK